MVEFRPDINTTGTSNNVQADHNTNQPKEVNGDISIFSRLSDRAKESIYPGGGYGDQEHYEAFLQDATGKTEGREPALYKYGLIEDTKYIEYSKRGRVYGGIGESSKSYNSMEVAQNNGGPRFGIYRSTIGQADSKPKQYTTVYIPAEHVVAYDSNKDRIIQENEIHDTNNPENMAKLEEEQPGITEYLQHDIQKHK